MDTYHFKTKDINNYAKLQMAYMILYNIGDLAQYVTTDLPYRLQQKRTLASLIKFQHYSTSVFIRICKTHIRFGA